LCFRELEEDTTEISAVYFKNHTTEISAVYFKNHVMHALTVLFGEVSSWRSFLREGNCIPVTYKYQHMA
jgi:hypothetical protein